MSVEQEKISVRIFVDMGDLLRDGGTAVLESPRLTPELLWTFCRNNDDLQIEQDGTGKLVIMAPGDAHTSSVNSEITYQLYEWNRRAGKPGIVFGSSAGLTLPSGAMRASDASWMSRAQWDAIPSEQKHRFAHACPEFVIELMSPSDRLAAAQDKMQEWIENGALLGWLIDLKNRKVYVYRPGAQMVTLDDPALVPADPEVAGFALETEDIFRKDTHE